MIPSLLVALVAIAGGTLASYGFDDDVAPATPGSRTGCDVGMDDPRVRGVHRWRTRPRDGPRPAWSAAAVTVLPLLVLARRRGAAPASGRRRRGAGRRSASRRPAVRRSRRRSDRLRRRWPRWRLARLRITGDLRDRTAACRSATSTTSATCRSTCRSPSSFAYGQNFPPQDPMFAGTGFAYPYLVRLPGGHVRGRRRVPARGLPDREPGSSGFALVGVLAPVHPDR